MNNEYKSSPASPIESRSPNVSGGEGVRPWRGLTKREAFAMAAMQGICASSPSVSNEIIAIEAINLADILLKQLENNQ